MSLPVVSEGFFEVFGSSAGVYFKSTENSSKVSSSSDEVVSIVSAKSVTPLAVCVTALAVCVTALAVCVVVLIVSVVALVV